MECVRERFDFVPASPEHSATKRLTSDCLNREALTRRSDNRECRAQDSPSRPTLANRRMDHAYCGEALATRPASLFRRPKSFLSSFKKYPDGGRQFRRTF